MLLTLLSVVASLACCSSVGSSVSRGSGSPMPTLSFSLVHHPDPSCSVGGLKAAGTASGSPADDDFQKLMLQMESPDGSNAEGGSTGRMCQRWAAFSCPDTGCKFSALGNLTLLESLLLSQRLHSLLAMALFFQKTNCLVLCHFGWCVWEVQRKSSQRQQ